MDTNRIYLKFVELYINAQDCMEVNVIQWKCKDMYGHAWESVELYRNVKNLWNCMECHGIYSYFNLLFIAIVCDFPFSFLSSICMFLFSEVVSLNALPILWPFRLTCHSECMELHRIHGKCMAMYGSAWIVWKL